MSKTSEASMAFQGEFCVKWRLADQCHLQQQAFLKADQSSTEDCLFVISFLCSLRELSGKWTRCNERMSPNSATYGSAATFSVEMTMIGSQ